MTTIDPGYVIQSLRPIPLYPIGETIYTPTVTTDGRVRTFGEWMSEHIKTYSAELDGEYIWLVTQLLESPSYYRARTNTMFCNAIHSKRALPGWKRHLEHLWCDYVFYVCSLPKDKVHFSDRYLIAKEVPSEEARYYGGLNGHPRMIPRADKPTDKQRAEELVARRAYDLRKARKATREDKAVAVAVAA